MCERLDAPGQDPPTSALASADVPERLPRPKLMSNGDGREAPKARRAHENDTCGIEIRKPPESAVHPSGIASRRICRRRRIDGVLHRWWRRIDPVLQGWRRWDVPVDHLRRRLAPGRRLVLELSNALLERQRLGPGRRLPGSIRSRCVCSARVCDADHARTLGRGEIADVDGSGRIGPRVDVGVSRLQPQRACDKHGQSCPENRRGHYRYHNHHNNCRPPRVHCVASGASGDRRVSHVNRLLLRRVVHGGRRPILDLLPSLLHCGRQLVHILDEERKRPDLLVAQRRPERRHTRQTNAVLDPPE
jgi:hypothetical protein